jgi:hypothetical protein
VLNNEATALVRLAERMSIRRVYLTGRLEKHREVTDAWLEKNLFWKRPNGIMRPMDKLKWQAARYKLDALRLLKLGTGVRQIFLFDDDEETCQFAETLGYVVPIHIKE